VGSSASPFTDPASAVVEMVTSAHPLLEAREIAEAVTSVAPTRTVLRRLAQALAARPAVLGDGRSPAPKVVGQLLLELRRRGASVAAPVCAGCEEQLSVLCRRGEDWMCHSCYKPRIVCASCGRSGLVRWVDRAGRPHCRDCPITEEDPTQVVLRVVAKVDPGLNAEKITAALDSAVPGKAVRRRLAWAIDDRPELLSGAGAETPVPSVLGFIEALVAAGATSIVQPPCPTCGRLVRLSGVWEARRVCRGCEARRKRVPCPRCGKLRPPGGRDDEGVVVCGTCFYRDPANQELCVGCARRRPVCVRDADGPRCESCREHTETTCSICGEFGVCETSKLTGRPWCRRCQKRRLACSGCGEVRLVRSGTLAQPRCGSCTESNPELWKSCPDCGEATKLVEGLCQACCVGRRLDEALAGPDGTVRSELILLRDSMAAERPDTTLDWLRKPAVARLLSDLGSGRLALTHEALDGTGPTKVVRHLRAVLVSTGALPPRDEHMVTLEGWVAEMVASRSDTEEAHLLRRYASWHLVRRLRRRQKTPEITHAQATNIKRHVRAAVLLLDWLGERGKTLATAGQGDLDIWVGQVGPARTSDAGNFVRWANAQRLTRLELRAVRWQGPSSAIDEELRWEQARRLLRDDTIATGDRVAGLLVLLYAQRVSTVARLTVADVEASPDGMRLRLGDRPIEVPEPLDQLITEIMANRRGHAAVGEMGHGQWLFPGGRPGQPISAYRLNERLAALGIRSGPARSAALMQLAAELPAAVIARMLGIHIKVAVGWQRLSSGDWTGYAADYSRRSAGAP